VTRNSRRLTIEELAVDCLDVREAFKAGALEGGWVNLRAGIRWPHIRKLGRRDTSFRSNCTIRSFLSKYQSHGLHVITAGLVHGCTAFAGGVWRDCLKDLAAIIVVSVAETPSMRARDETRRRGPTCRHIEPDSSSAGRVR
jgi:hypothetical protein